MDISITALLEHPLGGVRVQGTIDGSQLDYHLTDELNTPIATSIRKIVSDSETFEVVSIASQNEIIEQQQVARNNLIEQRRIENQAAQIQSINDQLEEFSATPISEMSEVEDAIAFISQSRAERFKTREQTIETS